MHAFGPEVECFVVAPFDRAVPEENRVTGKKRVHLVPLRTERFTPVGSSTRWTQDVVHAFSCKTPGGQDQLRLHYNAGRIDPAAFRELQNHIPGLQCLPMNEPRINGGNILIGGTGDFLMAGADLLNWYRRGLTGAARSAARIKLENQLRDKFGVMRIYWVNATEASGRLNGRQPFFHIDMYVSLAGQTDDNTELVFVGEIRNEYVFCNHSPEIAQLKEALDRTARWMENPRNHHGLKCRVLRLPVLVFNEQADHYGCYNNCLVEQTPGGRILYLPDFMPGLNGGKTANGTAQRIAAIQEQLRWKILKWNAGSVRFVSGGFFGLSRKMGSLRCMAKVIQRTGA